MQKCRNSKEIKCLLCKDLLSIEVEQVSGLLWRKKHITDNVYEHLQLDTKLGSSQTVGGLQACSLLRIAALPTRQDDVSVPRTVILGPGDRKRALVIS